MIEKKIPWNKGKKNIYSAETKKKMRDAKLGKSPWIKGKRHTMESKIKIGESVRKGYKEGIRTSWLKGLKGFKIKLKNPYFKCEKCTQKFLRNSPNQRFCSRCIKIREYENKVNYLKDPKKRDESYQRSKNWKEKNLSKIKNKILIRNSAQKVLLNPQCEICGSNENLNRHHWRYDKPLLVNTLCSSCHAIQHTKDFESSRFGRPLQCIQD